MDGKRSREESLVYILLEPTAFFRTLSSLTQRHTEKYVFSLSLFFESHPLTPCAFVENRSLSISYKGGIERCEMCFCFVCIFMKERDDSYEQTGTFSFQTAYDVLFCLLASVFWEFLRLFTRFTQLDLEKSFQRNTDTQLVACLSHPCLFKMIPLTYVVVLLSCVTSLPLFRQLSDKQEMKERPY